MRVIDLNILTKNVEEMLLECCCKVRPDVLELLQKAYTEEVSNISKKAIKKIIENDQYASLKNIPMCQDTGIVVCFLEIGKDVYYNGDIYEAINKGVENAYINGYLRKSVVQSPINRINTNTNRPAIIYTKIIPGDKIILKISPKGAGSENMSAIKMLSPNEGIEGIKKFVIDTISNSGAKACPPIIVGIGLGGDFEKSAMLAKEALFRKIDDYSNNEILKELEIDLLNEIDKLGIGAMGYGGTKTCLAVKINEYPCHVASLPVAINISCHASRHSIREL